METQKPLKALIFVNGDANDGPMVQRVLAEAQNAWVIAADGGARQAAHFGLKPQTVIGDMDSLSAAEISALEAGGASIHRYPEEKDETDLELALLKAAQGGANWIRVVAAVGDRLDQTLSNVYLLALPALQDVDVKLVAGNQEAWLLRSGNNVIQGASGDTLSLLPLSGAAHGVRTENLYYPLRGETLVFGPARGISNVLQTAEAHVWIDSGILLAVHTLGRA